MKQKKPKLRVRLGPAGRGRRMGTEIIGKQGYQRKDEKQKLKRVLSEDKVPAPANDKS